MPQIRRLHRFVGQPSQVGFARQFVAPAIQEADPAREVLMLLVSETATNALLHSASGREGGTFDVAYTRVPGRVRVEVHDQGGHGQGGPRRVLHDEDSMTGRGMELLDAYASRWGVLERPTGRTVWFELDVEEASDASAAGTAGHPAARPQPRPLRGGPPRSQAVGAGGRHARPAA